MTMNNVNELQGIVLPKVPFKKLERLWALHDKRGEYSSNLTKEELKEYEELCDECNNSGHAV